MMLGSKYWTDALAMSTIIMFVTSTLEIAQIMKEIIDNSTEFLMTVKTLHA